MSSHVPYESSDSTSPWPTILLSGGHITPALATIEYFQKQYPEIRLVFVGREYSQEKERQPAKERELCRQLGIPFYSLRAAKFHRAQWWLNAEELIRFIPSLYQAWKIIRTEKIDLFLSFGGYLAVPIALAAKLSGKKVVTHEQTKTSGLANELIANVADKVAISHESSRHQYPRSKTVFTGNPIRPSLLRTYKRRPSWIPESKKPILYITGGSQGSQTINNTVAQILPQLTEKFLVIHQCGQSEHQRYFVELQNRAQDLPPQQQGSYIVREWVDEKEISWILQNAALALSRSGANTIIEFTIHSLPAVFIPLPFAHNNEQFKNAQTLSDSGAAIILEQKELSAETLWATLKEASAQRANLRHRAEKLRASLVTNGAETLAELCLSLLRSHT